MVIMKCFLFSITISRNGMNRDNNKHIIKQIINDKNYQKKKDFFDKLLSKHEYIIDNGEHAVITVECVEDIKYANKIFKQSTGFYNCAWMVQSLLKFGTIQ